MTVWNETNIGARLFEAETLLERVRHRKRPLQIGVRVQEKGWEGKEKTEG